MNIPDKDGYTPLHLATLNQHVYCARLLLQIGASIAPETKYVYNIISPSIEAIVCDVVFACLQV